MADNRGALGLALLATGVGLAALSFFNKGVSNGDGGVDGGTGGGGTGGGGTGGGGNGGGGGGGGVPGQLSLLTFASGLEQPRLTVFVL